MNNEVMAQLSASLIEAAANNTASIITDKIKKAKTSRDDKKTINELESIINDLLADKQEIQRIAQAYEQELVTHKITEDDIKYIIDNLIPIFEKFVPDDNKEIVSQLKSILSVETLTIMQLIGFNYKQAIGEPLTYLVRNLIENNVPKDNDLNIKYLDSLAKIAQDKEATNRFYRLTNQDFKIEE
jgi:hypothetical protein